MHYFINFINFSCNPQDLEDLKIYARFDTQTSIDQDAKATPSYALMLVTSTATMFLIVCSHLNKLKQRVLFNKKCRQQGFEPPSPNH